VGVLLGQLLTIWIPINKNLWTSSYVVFTAGIALLVLAGCSWLVDIRGNRRLVYPLMLFGANPLTAYVLATFVASLLELCTIATATGMSQSLSLLLNDKLFAWWVDPYTSSLLFAVAYTGMWLIPLRWLYRQQIFVRL
jgi:predicted acyltransferase